MVENGHRGTNSPISNGWVSYLSQQATLEEAIPEIVLHILRDSEEEKSVPEKDQQE